MEMLQDNGLAIEPPKSASPVLVQGELCDRSTVNSDHDRIQSKPSSTASLNITAPDHEKHRTPNDPEDGLFDDFVEDLNDPNCVQQIYDFSLTQVRGMVDYNDEDDVIQEVFYRLTKWPIGKKYNSTKHYFSLLKITIRQSIAAYWKRRHSQRNDVRKRVFISELILDGASNFDFTDFGPSNSLNRYHIKELVQLVLKHVQTLPAKQKTMFQLRFLQQKSHEEIAIQLGISIRTSYRLETKVREILQARFDGDSDGVITWSAV